MAAHQQPLHLPPTTPQPPCTTHATPLPWTSELAQPYVLPLLLCGIFLALAAQVVACLLAWWLWGVNPYGRVTHVDVLDPGEEPESGSREKGGEKKKMRRTRQRVASFDRGNAIAAFFLSTASHVQFALEGGGMRVPWDPKPLTVMILGVGVVVLVGVEWWDVDVIGRMPGWMVYEGSEEENGEVVGV